MPTKKLSLFDATMIIMGSMIGSGIFIVTSEIAQNSPSSFIVMLVWVLAAVMTLMGAISYGELAGMMPKAGGQYIYLREAYGALIGFLYGWALFSVIQTGTIAAVAMGFSKYTGVLIPIISEKKVFFTIGNFPFTSQKLLSLIVIWSLTIFSFGRVKNSALIQNIFTVTKILSLVFIFCAGLYFVFMNSQTRIPIDFSFPDTISTYHFWGIFSAALVGAFFSLDAWNNVTFISGEINNPKKNIPRSLILGVGGVCILYLFVNWVYVSVLSMNEIANVEEGRVGTLLLQTIFGNIGLVAMAILIIVSTFGCMNGMIVSGSRVYYALAKDKLFFNKASKLNNKHSPQYALIIQAIWISFLIFSGTYNSLLNYIIFVVLIFYILTIFGIIILRRKQANIHRPYKVFAYPILPITYILLALFICVNLLIYKFTNSFAGLVIVLLGIPIYFIMIKKKHKQET